MSATADDPTWAAKSAVWMHHPIGISTGVFREARGAWSELVAEASAVSSYAVELSALSGEELPGLLAYLRSEPRLPFSYVSVHAPVKNHDQGDGPLVGLLDELPLWVRSIVTHPDSIRDAEPYRALGTRLVLENMDHRKGTGRIADELESFFQELPEAGFCLDVAHARSIDETMDVAREMLDRFRVRLRQVHLSSLAGDHHVSLTDHDEKAFEEVLDRCRDVPWILEAPPPGRWADQLKASGVVAAGI